MTVVRPQTDAQTRTRADSRTRRLTFYVPIAMRECVRLSDIYFS